MRSGLSGTMRSGLSAARRTPHAARRTPHASCTRGNLCYVKLSLITPIVIKAIATFDSVTGLLPIFLLLFSAQVIEGYGYTAAATLQMIGDHTYGETKTNTNEFLSSSKLCQDPLETGDPVLFFLQC